MVDLQPQSQQPMSDDQELAKVLAGVDGQAEEAAAAEDTADEKEVKPTDTTDAAVEEATLSVPTIPMPSASGSDDLDSIKQDALVELRPLVDKLDLAPEEKFDTYLLLLRSTDDKTLIGPAHEAAKAISDETRRAQALLDVIKEIDFLSSTPTA